MPRLLANAGSGNRATCARGPRETAPRLSFPDEAGYTFRAVPRRLARWPRGPANRPSWREMKRLVVDIDGTLTMRKESDVSYSDVPVRADVVDQLRQYKEMGFSIILFSSRGMRSYQSSVGHLNAHVLPVMIEWLRRHDVPYDELHIGKPWCGEDGFYVDDRAVRPSEFLSKSYEELRALVKNEEIHQAPAVRAE
jgi:capsule biosynthesis phosphatase